MKVVIILAGLLLAGLTSFFFPTLAIVLVTLLLALIAFFTPFVVFVALTPLLKERLKHDPNSQDGKFAMFAEVKEGTAMCIIRGGEPIYTISNNRRGTYVRVFPHGEESSEALLLKKFVRQKNLKPWVWFWRRYQQYIYETSGLFPYIPFFTEPYSYPLPRLEQVTAKRDDSVELVDYRQISDGPRYRTNHVRHQVFTWYFVYRSVDIQKIPFTVIGSAQVSIRDDRVREALFATDSWNILLDMALREVVRSVLRSQISLDHALGVIGGNLKDEREESRAKASEPEKDLVESDMLRLGQMIHSALKKYHIEHTDLTQDNRSSTKPKTLEEFGLVIGRVGINDLTDELSQTERAKFFAAAIAREEGRAAALRGMGEAEAAKALQSALMELEDSDLAREIVKGRFFAEGLRNSNAIEGLAGALTQRTL